MMNTYTIEFVPKFTLPFFIFYYSDFPDMTLACSRKGCRLLDCTLPNSKYLRIAFRDVNPTPAIKEDKDKIVFLIGSPIVDDSINQDAVLSNIFIDNQVNQKFLSKLNGEFLIFIVNKNSGGIFTINDRFTSIPLYYSVSEREFTASPYFTDLWYLKKQKNGLKINEYAFFEFLWFQRIIGAKTYLEDVSFLPDASVMKLDAKGVSISRYWNRNYGKSSLSVNEHAEKLAHLVRQSVKRKTSDNVRYGHFLSGGMDSRSVLAAFSENLPVCFTSAISENRELLTARKIALTKGAKHIFLKFGEHHYADILKTAVQLIGGMYNFDHAIFLGYEDAVRKEADVCFHGHGFDYMFQGMYIPSQRVRVMGRNLYLRKMKPLPDDLTSYFIHNASYRTKGGNIYEYVRKEKLSQIKEFQYESVKEILSQADLLTDNPYDKWEFLTFHYISRHYSFPNHASIATYREQRVISFDNDIFDFYLSLPVEQRFDGKIEKACLKLLDNNLARIPSANTGLPVTASCLTQTVYQIADALKRRLLRLPEPDEWKERTWLKRDEVIKAEQSIRRAINDILSSESMKQFDWFDIEHLRNDIHYWLEGKGIPSLSGDIVTSILTIGTFLSEPGIAVNK